MYLPINFYNVTKLKNRIQQEKRFKLFRADGENELISLSALFVPLYALQRELGLNT